MKKGRPDVTKRAPGHDGESFSLARRPLFRFLSWGYQQAKFLLPKFHRNRTRKYNNTALGLFGWVSLTERLLDLFDWAFPPAGGWRLGWMYTAAGPGRARRHTA
jgi:hypothetical protein